jgi:glycerol dehydrogenase
MRNGSPIMLGSGRYIQCPGAISQLGKEALCFGKKLLVIAGETAWEKVGKEASASLEENGIAFQVHRFKGYCSESNVNNIAEEAKSYGAELIVGVGGGKCIDTSKWTANKLGLRCITVPTAASTCAPYVTLCVMYDDTGSTLRSVFTEQEVAAVIVDTDVIVKKCPPRMFASGMADALAKFPEVDFSMIYSTDWEKSVLPSMALEIAIFNTGKYYEKGLQALEDVKLGRNTPAAEDILCTNIVLTGMVSALASGGKQLAIAHSFYDCVATLFKPQRAKYLHGEIVSCGIAIQMGTNGYSEEDINKTVGFLRSIGTPTKLRDLDIEPNEENLNTIYGYVFNSLRISDIDLQKKIEKNFERIL